MNSIKTYFKEYFSNNFLIRLTVWIIANIAFLFGLALILIPQMGLATYDALLQPIRVLFGVGGKEYKVILIPVGILFYLISGVLNYLRTKKVRIDFIIGIVYIISTGFILDEILKMKVFSEVLGETGKVTTTATFVEYPEYIPVVFGGGVLFMVGIGVLSACGITPNNYAALVEEISIASKKSFKFVQYMFDVALVAMGLLIAIINIYATKTTKSGNEITWFYLLRYIGLGTVLILLTQSYIIDMSMVKTRKLFELMNKKERI